MNMETSKEQIAARVFIDCPVCCSGNRFQLENLDVELACNDCGFVLAEAPKSKAVDSGRCVFCASEYFYFESPLSLSLLGKDSVCYVCEARYKGAPMSSPEQKYSPESQAKAQGSDASESWRKRVEWYAQGEG